MTLIVSVRSYQGVVLASDSLSSGNDSPFYSQKIAKFGSLGIGFYGRCPTSLASHYMKHVERYFKSSYDLILAISVIRERRKRSSNEGLEISGHIVGFGGDTPATYVFNVLNNEPPTKYCGVGATISGCQNTNCSDTSFHNLSLEKSANWAKWYIDEYDLAGTEKVGGCVLIATVTKKDGFEWLISPSILE